MTSRTIQTRSASIEINGGTVTKRYHQKNRKLYHNDCYWLRSLATTPVVPSVYASSDDNLTIEMSYSGEPLSAANAPDDWEEQISAILSLLSTADCHHGDLLPQNILVQDKKLRIIDFATASPYTAHSTTKRRTFSDDYAANRLRYLLNGSPEKTEIHAFVVWNAREASKIEAKIRGKLEVIDKIALSPRLYQDHFSDRRVWLKHFYNTPYLKGSPKGKEPFCALIVLSKQPDYKPRNRVFSPEMRIVNTEIFDLKCSLRAGREGYLHSSDNQEEARRNLRYLSYDEKSLPYRYFTKTRPKFESMTEVFDALNRLREAEYVLLRKPSGDADSYRDDYDLLCTDYFAVKRALGGISYKLKSHKLFQNVGAAFDEGGFKVANYVLIGGHKVSFDIRHVGDGYYPRAWQEQMLRAKVFRDGVFQCAPEDEFFARAYHALFHKARFPIKYRDQFCATMGIENTSKMVSLLRERTLAFLGERGYTATRPKDITIPYSPPQKSRYAELREMFLVRREIASGNYSGASKVLLNYVRVYGADLTAFYWFARMVYLWTKADLREKRMSWTRKLGNMTGGALKLSGNSSFRIMGQARNES